jgi:hypothetical protein
MTLHRVKSTKIPVSEFKPDSRNHRPKEIRWFRNESPRDYGLSVKDERDDETFILMALTSSPQLIVPEGKEGHISIIEESLDQNTVDKIEKAGDGSLLAGRDFVIFQNSPKCRELCRRR